MFEIGDIVKIYPHEPAFCWPDSPALNLIGTIARINSKVKDGKYNGAPYYYTLEFIEIKARKPEKFKEHDAKLHWHDEHLVLVEKNKEYGDMDTSELFE